ncbi:MAG: Kae1-associated kinase Bud32 [Caldisphaeraceae archaeon]|nr:Kae1-associated kinase Bud32 [Caldisphaeraceae archaeon]
MVLFDGSRVLKGIEGFDLIKKGAESEIRLGTFLGEKAIYKVRLRKAYMHPYLDSELRHSRTKKEARIMMSIREKGINAPLVYAVYPSIGLIVMEYISAPSLKDLLSSNSEKALGYFYEVGVLLSRLHSMGIVHGDFTTSNVLIKGSEIFLIDFGLSEFSNKIEDRAMDLHLFRRAILSTHPSAFERGFHAFLDAYSSHAKEADEVIKRSQEIELRGRYVGLRRRSEWNMHSL